MSEEKLRLIDKIRYLDLYLHGFDRVITPLPKQKGVFISKVISNKKGINYSANYHRDINIVCLLTNKFNSDPSIEEKEKAVLHYYVQKMMFKSLSVSTVIDYIYLTLKDVRSKSF